MIRTRPAPRSADVNTKLQDVLLRRAVDRTRHENATVKDLYGALARSQAVILNAIKHAGIFTGERPALGLPVPDRHHRLDPLLQQVVIAVGQFIQASLVTTRDDLHAQAQLEMHELPRVIQATLDDHVRVAPTLLHEAKDASGHEHAPAGSSQGGQFVSGGGSGGGGKSDDDAVLWHGTSVSMDSGAVRSGLQNLLRQGLKRSHFKKGLSSERNRTRYGQLKAPVVYVTTSEADAAMFAHLRASDAYHPGTVPVIMKVVIPASEVAKLSRDPEKFQNAWIFHGDVKPEWIRQVWMAKKPGGAPGPLTLGDIAEPSSNPSKWSKVRRLKESQEEANTTLWLTVFIPLDALTPEFLQEALDASGHEHAPAGSPEGGQFTSKDDSGGGGSSEETSSPKDRLYTLGVTLVDETKGGNNAPVADAIEGVISDLASSSPEIAAVFQRGIRVVLRPGKNVQNAEHSALAMGYYNSETKQLTVAAGLRLSKPAAQPKVGVGEFNVGTDFRTILSHELGHALSGKIAVLGSQAGVLVGKSLYDSRPKSYWEKTVSHYAAKNHKELMAEAFAAYTHPGYSSGKPLPSQLVAVFEAAKIPPGSRRVIHEAADQPWVSSFDLGPSFTQVPSAQITELLGTPLGGAFFQSSFADLGASLVSGIRNALTTGLATGASVPKVSRLVQGLLGGARYKSERIVRSEYVRVAAQAALSTYAQNADVLKGVQWVSTLDKRTCLQCAKLDQKTWPTAEEALIPVRNTHPNCRCVVTPIVKNANQLGLPPGSRASFNGQVPDTLSYEDWFAQQSDAFQRDVLGSTRYNAYASGKADLGTFATARGVRPVRDVVKNLRESYDWFQRQDRLLSEVKDASGHEHAPAGSPEGGQFTSGGGEGGGGGGAGGPAEYLKTHLVYHGTSRTFTNFNPTANTLAVAGMGPGIYFAENPTTASDYAKESAGRAGKGRQRVIAATLDVQHPFEMGRQYSGPEVMALVNAAIAIDPDAATAWSKWSAIPGAPPGASPGNRVAYKDVAEKGLDGPNLRIMIMRLVSDAQANEPFERAGYDAVVNNKSPGNREWLVFHPHQIRQGYRALKESVAIAMWETQQEAKDASGHEHAPAGSSAGGQFTSGGSSGSGGKGSVSGAISSDTIAATLPRVGFMASGDARFMLDDGRLVGLRPGDSTHAATAASFLGGGTNVEREANGESPDQIVKEFLQRSGSARVIYSDSSIGATVAKPMTSAQTQLLVKTARQNQIPLTIDTYHATGTASKVFPRPTVDAVNAWVASQVKTLKEAKDASGHEHAPAGSSAGGQFTSGGGSGGGGSETVGGAGSATRPTTKTVASLTTRLLKLGGTYIAGPEQMDGDPDAGRILKDGALYPTAGATKALGNDAHCHWNVAKLYEKGTIDGIAIGYARTPSNVRDDQWHQHTWGVKGGHVVETTASNVGDRMYFGITLTGPEANTFVKWTTAHPPGGGVVRRVPKGKKTFREAKDASGHEHAPAGSSTGGQFTSGDSSGGGADKSAGSKQPPVLDWVAPPPPRGLAGGKAGGFSATGITNTEIGDLGELAVQQLELKSLLGNKRQGPLDAQYDSTKWAFEIKTCTTQATEYKVKMKAHELAGKKRFARKNGYTPATMILVLDVPSRTAWAYWKPGLGNYQITPGTQGTWNYMGQVSLPASKRMHEALDASGHEHAPAGSPEGGQFSSTSTGGGGKAEPGIESRGAKYSGVGSERLRSTVEVSRTPVPAEHLDGVLVTGHNGPIPLGAQKVNGTYNFAAHEIQIAMRPLPSGGGLFMNADVASYAVRHELGHHVHLTKMTTAAAAEWAVLSNKGQNAKITAYARTNSGEHFAEAYAHYNSRDSIVQQKLVKLEPPVAAFMERLMTTSTMVMPVGKLTKPVVAAKRYTA